MEVSTLMVAIVHKFLIHGTNIFLSMVPSYIGVIGSPPPYFFLGWLCPAFTCKNQWTELWSSVRFSYSINLLVFSNSQRNLNDVELSFLTLKETQSWFLMQLEVHFISLSTSKVASGDTLRRCPWRCLKFFNIIFPRSLSRVNLVLLFAMPTQKPRNSIVKFIPELIS